MKNITCLAGLLLLSFIVIAQGVSEKPVILYGAIKKENMKAAPFDQWFNTGYDSYQPDAESIKNISRLNTKDIRIDIFLGTWCGDSKREVPRFLKVLDQVSFSEKNLNIIGVGGSDSLLKQSPQGQEAGKGIFRVPVFIIYRNGTEIGRINEFPSISLEKDLYTILGNQPYTPNYRSFSLVNSWLANGVLADKNSSTRGLASQLKPLVAGEYELNGLGYLLLKQGRKAEALKIFQVNASIFPESANILSSLGEGYLENGDKTNAVLVLERALELNKDPQLVKPILKILYEAKK